MTRFHLPRVPHAAFAVINPTVRLLLRSPASNPANLPQWAPGFFKSIANRDSRWLAETTMGEVTFIIAPRNTHGVLEHGVTLSTGESSFNPMRVAAELDARRATRQGSEATRGPATRLIAPELT